MIPLPAEVNSCVPASEVVRAPAESACALQASRAGRLLSAATAVAASDAAVESASCAAAAG